MGRLERIKHGHKRFWVGVLLNFHEKRRMLDAFKPKENCQDSVSVNSKEREGGRWLNDKTMPGPRLASSIAPKGPERTYGDRPRRLKRGYWEVTK